jgi:hypothetical protein
MLREVGIDPVDQIRPALRQDRSQLFGLFPGE